VGDCGFLLRVEAVDPESLASLFDGGRRDKGALDLGLGRLVLLIIRSPPTLATAAGAPSSRRLATLFLTAAPALALNLLAAGCPSSAPTTPPTTSPTATAIRPSFLPFVGLRRTRRLALGSPGA
jgi:hypothetical protein